MNPTAIYSKSGKGVQEAAGKTSLLARPDRAVLSAIDGRATLADVAQKVGKAFDAAFKGLVSKLDKEGFIREVTPGVASVAAAAPSKPAFRPAPKSPPRPSAPADPASDLDFSMLGATKPKSSPAPAPKPAPASRPAVPPTPTAPPTPTTPPPKEQESALFKARQEAEAKAQAERDRVRMEAESKLRAETEAKLRAEAESKLRAELETKTAAANEAKVNAARQAKEEADRLRREAEERERKAKEEAERIRQEAEEKAQRARQEAEEKARREAEELRQRLEAERKAREEAERKAKEETERARREIEEERRKLEEERRRREDEERREAEERTARRKAEQEEEAREAAEREARRKAREEEEAREAEEREARRKARADEEAREAEARAASKARKDLAREDEPVEAEKAASAGGFADSLLADLDSFNTREEDEPKEKAEAERKIREEVARRSLEEQQRRAQEEERRAQDEAKKRAKEEAAQKKREEEERLRRDEEEEKARIRLEEERREREAQERERRAKEEEALARKAQSAVASDYQQDKRRQRALAAGKPREGDDSRIRRRPAKWGRPVALTLFLVLIGALGAAHVMPIATVDYERAASEALGRPVRLGQARLWLLTGLQLRFEGASAGDIKIARIIAHPHISSLTDRKKAFSTIELEGVSLPQAALGALLFARLKSDTFSVDRVVARGLELPGPMVLPQDLQAEISLGAGGAVRMATVRGADGLVARLEPKGSTVDFQLDAGSFTLPIAPEVSLGQFGMKGTADVRGMQIKQWDGTALNGTLSGTARVRWGGVWAVDGVITARGINAAVFAPALLSEGRGEGTGRFSLNGAEPAKLGTGGRIEGNFTVSKGVLGSFDLSRAIQTSGKSAQGRTQFAEMNGHAVYDRGVVTLRNVTIGAGALNAGASADIAQGGALTGRIVADVRTASQTLSATLNLGGTVKEPQVRN